MIQIILKCADNIFSGPGSVFCVCDSLNVVTGVKFDDQIAVRCMIAEQLRRCGVSGPGNCIPDKLLNNILGNGFSFMRGEFDKRIFRFQLFWNLGLPLLHDF